MQDAQRFDPLGDDGQNPLLPNQQAFFLQLLLKSGFLETGECLLKARQCRQAFVDSQDSPLRVKDAAARFLQLQAQLAFSSVQGWIALDEAAEQQSQFFPALGEFGDLVLSEYLDLFNDVLRTQGEQLAGLVLHHWRVRHRTLDGVATRGWMMRMRQQRNFGAAAQN